MCVHAAPLLQLNMTLNILSSTCRSDVIFSTCYEKSRSTVPSLAVDFTSLTIEFIISSSNRCCLFSPWSFLSFCFAFQACGLSLSVARVPCICRVLRRCVIIALSGCLLAELIVLYLKSLRVVSVFFK